MDQIARSTMRQAKNFTKGYSDVQVKVREATSNDPWGPSGTQMGEIADCTYRTQDFMEIMDILDKRLNDSGKNWRHVFKALTLLDYLLHCGSEQVIAYAKQNLYVIKTLKEFQFVDDEGKDQGANVREKSKQIASLLSDDDRLRDERKSRAALRQKLGQPGIGNGGSVSGTYNNSLRFDGGRHERSASYEPRSEYEEERQVEKALEESRRLEDERRQKEKEREEAELRKALELSKSEAAGGGRSNAVGGSSSQQQQISTQQQQQQQRQQQVQPQQSQQQGMIDLWGDANVDQNKNDLDFFGSMAQTQPVQQSQPDPFGFSPGKMPMNQSGSIGGQQSQYDMYGNQAHHYTQGGNGSAFGQPLQQSQALVPQQQQQQQQQQVGGATDFFDSAFDGGAGQKNLVPKYVQGQQNMNPNAALAHIARNATQIDPFANLAANSSSGAVKSGSASNFKNSSNDLSLFGAGGSSGGSAPPSQQNQQAMQLYGGGNSMNNQMQPYSGGNNNSFQRPQQQQQQQNYNRPPMFMGSGYSGGNMTMMQQQPQQMYQQPQSQYAYGAPAPGYQQPNPFGFMPQQQPYGGSGFGAGNAGGFGGQQYGQQQQQPPVQGQGFTAQQTSNQQQQQQQKNNANDPFANLVSFGK
ncbi:hypothetical protein MP228_007559 [Amoeboaphelidium protococcarum]|nr:hypothetical protein MP228_007559 [Amoeboaphelidium protococcarum]